MKWKITAEIHDPTSQSKSPGLAGPIAGIHQNKLIIAGGSNFPEQKPWQGGKKKYYDDIYLFVKKRRQILQEKKTFKLPFNIAYAACCTVPEGIIFAGGENENGISDKVFLLQWDAASEKIQTKNLPDLPVAITNAAATIKDRIVYLAGGETTSGTSSHFYSLHLDELSKGWKQLPEIPHPVSHAALTAHPAENNSSIYLFGGRNKKPDGISELYSDTYSFDVNNDRWIVKKPIPYPLSAGTFITHDSDCVLLFGGEKGETFHQVETLIAAINAEKNELAKQALIQQKNTLLENHPGFSKEILSYNISSDVWTVAGMIPYDVPVTTTALQWQKNVIIPNGEIKAGIRTAQILSATINLKCK
jgi:cyclically-permuted mutarotase family protein